MIITGDDFEKAHPVATTCACTFMSTSARWDSTPSCTVTTAIWRDLQNPVHARGKKCGQRGIQGHSPLPRRPRLPSRQHGNAVEYGHQRGIVMHDTHFSTVTQNALYDVTRCWNLPIEDRKRALSSATWSTTRCWCARTRTMGHGKGAPSRVPTTARPMVPTTTPTGACHTPTASLATGRRTPSTVSSSIPLSLPTVVASLMASVRCVLPSAARGG